MIIVVFSMDLISSTINKLSISTRIKINTDPRNLSTPYGLGKHTMMAGLHSCSEIYPTNTPKKWYYKKQKLLDQNSSMTSFTYPLILRYFFHLFRMIVMLAMLLSIQLMYDLYKSSMRSFMARNGLGSILRRYVKCAMQGFKAHPNS